MIKAIIHNCPLEILENQTYKNWINNFETDHIFTEEKLQKFEENVELDKDLTRNFEFVNFLNEYFPRNFPKLYGNILIKRLIKYLMFIEGNPRFLKEKNLDGNKYDIENVLKNVQNKILYRNDFNYNLYPPKNSGYFSYKEKGVKNIINTKDDFKKIAENFNKFHKNNLVRKILFKF